MDLTHWLNELTGGATAKDVARKAEISERTLQHQTRSGKLSVENAVKISTAYGRHPLRTLIDLGVIDAAWAQVPDVQAALKIATNEDLTGEIMERLELAEHDPIYDVPVDELAERRRAQELALTTPDESSNDQQDDTEITPSVRPTEYVADDTDTEPEMGDDDYHDGP